MLEGRSPCEHCPISHLLLNNAHSSIIIFYIASSSSPSDLFEQARSGLDSDLQFESHSIELLILS